MGAAGAGGGAVANEVEEAAPVIANTVQSCAPRIAQAFDVVETRIAALEASYPEVVPWLERWRDTELQRYLPSWYVEMIHWDAEFKDLVELLMARYGMTFAQAWNYLVGRLGIDPETW